MVVDAIALEVPVYQTRHEPFLCDMETANQSVIRVLRTNQPREQGR